MGDLKLLLGVAGMPGSGKGVISSVARSLGITTISMGDIVREEAIRLGLDISRKVLARLAVELRIKEGPDAIAKRCINIIRDLDTRYLLVDGLRSHFEYYRFKDYEPNFKLIFVHASPGTRFRRLLRRGRSDDPKTWEDFVYRDISEIRLGLPVLFFLSDYVIVNENKPLVEVFREAHELIRRLLIHANSRNRRSRGEAYREPK